MSRSGRITVRLHIAFGGVRAAPRALADEVAEAGPPTREMTAAAAAAAVRILDGTEHDWVHSLTCPLMSLVAVATRSCGRSRPFWLMVVLTAYQRTASTIECRSRRTIVRPVGEVSAAF